MRSYEVVGSLLIFNTILAYIYTKNILILVIGVIVGIGILIGIRVIFEKFVE